MMREAITAVLATPSYREVARALATQLAGIDGAINAADAIEQMLPETLREASCTFSSE
jgi:UDP:flavonoid glycosyltransferase YjiC (YdhE family)